MSKSRILVNLLASAACLLSATQEVAGQFTTGRYLTAQAQEPAERQFNVNGPQAIRPEPGGDTKLFLKKIVLAGNSDVVAAELNKIIGRYEKRYITTEELHSLRQELSQYYADNGYINSGVVIPTQEVTDQVVHLRAVEGELTEIEVSGNRGLKQKYIKDRIALGADKPLNMRTLEQSLRLLERDPLIRQITANLQPGLKRGESVLKVEIKRNQPYQLTLGADNERSPSVGGEQARITATNRNLTGWGDSVRADLGATEGLEDVSLSYAFPVNARGTSVGAFYETSESDVIEEPFNLIDIENESETFGISLTHPFLSGPGNSLVGSVGFEKKHTETFLLGLPFSFSPGAQNGESDVSVLPLGLNWTTRSQNQVFALGSTFRVGIDALDATINEAAPDSEFVTWQGQAQYARRLAFLSSQVVFRTFSQLALDPLLPAEKFAVGGMGTVRGYRENQFVRDNGVVASLEMQLPLFPQTRSPWINRLQLVPFVDYGRSWDKDNELPTSNAQDIYSAGLGLLWDPLRHLHAELFWGHALRDVGNPDNDLQDDGIHFVFRYNVF